RGNRPGFSRAAAPDEGRRLYEQFCSRLAGLGIPTATGRFAADMQVALVNDGPVTVWLDNRAGCARRPSARALRLDQAASWKMMPRVWRMPERTRLTPCRRFTR